MGSAYNTAVISYRYVSLWHRPDVLPTSRTCCSCRCATDCSVSVNAARTRRRQYVGPMLQTDIRCTPDKDDIMPTKARRSQVDWDTYQISSESEKLFVDGLTTYGRTYGRTDIWAPIIDIIRSTLRSRSKNADNWIGADNWIAIRNYKKTWIKWVM